MRAPIEFTFHVAIRTARPYSPRSGVRRGRKFSIFAATTAAGTGKGVGQGFPYEFL
jgi:hypothetical protein